MNALIDDRKVLVILPHIDDEFAMVPVIKYLAGRNPEFIRFVYCAERNNGLNKKRMKRRKENIESLNILGVKENNIFYLNDKFNVDDLYLYKSKELIYKFLFDYHAFYSFEKVLTLAYEGGHPDHDCLALIINRFCIEKNVLNY